MGTAIAHHALLMAQAAAVVDPTALAIYNKIVAWWEHAVDSSNALLDSHTGGHNLTPSGSFTYGAAALAAGLPTCTKWVGTGSHMDAAHATALNLGSSYAVMAWFKRDGSQPGFAKLIAKSTDAPNGKGTYYLTYVNATGKLQARFNSGGTYYDIDGATTVANLTTYQAIFNKNTTGSDLYVNNTLDGSQASGGTPDTASNPVIEGSTGFSDSFIGFRSSTALFNSPLTSTERAYLYNSGSGVSYATLKAAAGH